jgi:hypothetical protein
MLQTLKWHARDLEPGSAATIEAWSLSYSARVPRDYPTGKSVGLRSPPDCSLSSPFHKNISVFQK